MAYLSLTFGAVVGHPITVANAHIIVGTLAVCATSIGALGSYK